MGTTVGIYRCENNGGTRLLMPIPWAVGQVKGRSWIAFHGHGGFTVLISHPCPSSRGTKPGRSSKGRTPISCYQMVPMSYLVWICFTYSLFKCKKISVENSLYLQALYVLGENKAIDSQCCEHVASDHGGFFGKVPGRLFLEEKHWHFSCGNLIGSRIGV